MNIVLSISALLVYNAVELQGVCEELEAVVGEHADTAVSGVRGQVGVVGG